MICVPESEAAAPLELNTTIMKESSLWSQCGSSCGQGADTASTTATTAPGGANGVPRYQGGGGTGISFQKSRGGKRTVAAFLSCHTRYSLRDEATEYLETVAFIDGRYYAVLDLRALLEAGASAFIAEKIQKYAQHLWTGFEKSVESPAAAATALDASSGGGARQRSDDFSHLFSKGWWVSGEIIVRVQTNS
eukprot:GHVU01116196.1.p1 GENE.GHVU01116196.1~~GHVU01116196.1.p1  ORF type:complete len:192 (-),score=26.10 GHVU01116196.1:334-909(-)